MSILLNLALVAFGSALGGLARYGVASTVIHFGGVSVLHWATMAVNISGSFFLGWFVVMLKEVWTVDPQSWMRTHAVEIELLIAVGFTGGYTTFSSFEAQTYDLLRQGLNLIAILYVVGSVFLGLIAFRSGMLLAGGT